MSCPSSIRQRDSNPRKKLFDNKLWLRIRNPVDGQRGARLERLAVLHHRHRHPVARRQERRVRKGLGQNVLRRRQGDRDVGNGDRSAKVQDRDRRCRPTSINNDEDWLVVVVIYLLIETHSKCFCLKKWLKWNWDTMLRLKGPMYRNKFRYIWWLPRSLFRIVDGARFDDT